MTGRPPWRDLAIWYTARRMKLGISREVLAARLGISVKRFAEYERGRTCPSDTIAHAWDNALWKEAP